MVMSLYRTIKGHTGTYKRRKNRVLERRWVVSLPRWGGLIIDVCAQRWPSDSSSISASKPQLELRFHKKWKYLFCSLVSLAPLNTSLEFGISTNHLLEIGKTSGMCVFMCSCTCAVCERHLLVLRVRVLSDYFFALLVVHPVPCRGGRGEPKCMQRAMPNWWWHD